MEKTYSMLVDLQHILIRIVRPQMIGTHNVRIMTIPQGHQPTGRQLDTLLLWSGDQLSMLDLDFLLGHQTKEEMQYMLLQTIPQLQIVLGNKLKM